MILLRILKKDDYSLHNLIFSSYPLEQRHSNMNELTYQRILNFHTTLFEHILNIRMNKKQYLIYLCFLFALVKPQIIYIYTRTLLLSHGWDKNNFNMGYVHQINIILALVKYRLSHVWIYSI